MYESRVKTLSLRVPDDPAARLAAVLELTEALARASDEVAVAARACRVGSDPSRRKRRAAEASGGLIPRPLRRRHQPSRRLTVRGRYAPDLVPRKDRRIVVAVVLAALLVALFVVVAIAQGIGNPSVSSDDVAVVEDAPDSEITRRSSTPCWSRRPPCRESGRSRRRPTRSTRPCATRRCPTCSWGAGSAVRPRSAGSPSPTARSTNRLEEIIEQQFGGQKEFQQFLKQAQFTPEEARERVELQLLSDQIQKEVLPQDAGRLGLRDRGLLRGQQGAVRAAGDA